MSKFDPIRYPVVHDTSCTSLIAGVADEIRRAKLYWSSSCSVWYSAFWAQVIVLIVVGKGIGICPALPSSNFVPNYWQDDTQFFIQ